METLSLAPTDTTSSTYSRKPPVTARAATAMLFFVNGALFATWVSRIPAIQTALGLSHKALGFALLGVAVGALVAMPLAGRLITRLGSHRVSQIAAVLYFLTMPGLALAPNAWLLALALFWFGAAHGAFDVAMNAQAVGVEDLYERPIMSSFHALWSVGGLTGAVCGGFVAAAHISPLAHFTTGTLLLGTATVALAFPRLLDAGEADGPVLPEDRPRRFTWPSKTILSLGALAFCIMMGEGAMADWSALFLRDATGANEGLAAAGYAAFSIAMAASRFGGDVLAARFGSVALVRGGSVLAAAGLAIALVVSHPAVALVGFAAVGAGFATIVPQVFSAVGRIPGVLAGPALATATTLGYSGFLIGPPFIGFAAEHVGLRVALGFIVVMSAVPIALAPSVRRADAIPR